MLASRSRLLLAAFALLASGGVMAAAAPDDMNKRGGNPHNSNNDSWQVAASRDNDRFDLRINVGAHDWGRHRGRGHDHTPAVAEVMPRALQLQAFQTGDTVIVLASGENTTTGFVTSLEREAGDRRRDGRTGVVLHNVGPVGRYSGQACAPFSVSGSFHTRERLNEIIVCIDGHDRCIPVQRIDQMRTHR
ncbi:MAG TPA: hypothetical protein VFF65_04820 [Phycisphaerales bacterium]|nr:hypothetical protein [Phycisphaerales bacterium]